MQNQHQISFARAATELGYLSRQDLMSEMSRQFSYPILTGHSYGSQFSRELVVGHEPFSAAAEAIRSIRTSIVSSAIAQGIRSFAVTYPRPGTGGTFFASNIALAFAQMAIPTVLVDANLRDPRVAEMFGLAGGGEGLSHALRSRNIDEVAIVPDVIPGLSILTAGIIPPNPQELLSSGEFLALANNLEKSFGVVIYDTAPAMEFADAAVVAARVGAAIIVARQHETSFDDIAAMSGKFRAAQCKFLGTVMNAF
ncbi:MAG TPA: polysaccharide biosynthesis tyrosine autokinase [Pseudorhodoplanes sp.]|nr:polysaccharide biosynthesis tyrosine autokinase [Pseudorhodoplanes sp.]